MRHVVEFDEGQRQAVLLALAKLTFARPGWLEMLRELATKLRGAEMFEEFRRHGPDRGAPGVCKLCGCTEGDCRGCVSRAGQPCSWANEERTLCTACVGKLLRLGL